MIVEASMFFFNVYIFTPVVMHIVVHGGCSRSWGQSFHLLIKDHAKDIENIEDSNTFT